MDAAANITAALHGAHQVARSRGIQSRALLALLVEIDNGRHLDAPSREHVSADIAAFTHVSSSPTSTGLLLTDRPGSSSRL
jgi:mediator of RNA polymerase II transcription subunit 12